MKSVSGLRRFQSFVEERRRLGDWSKYCSADMTRLSRVMLVEACGIKRSLIYQNSHVAALLRDVESELTEQGILGARPAEPILSAQSGSICDVSFEQRIVDLSASILEFDQYLNDVCNSLMMCPLPRSK